MSGEGPALHASGIDMHARCGVQFEKVYLEGQRRPPRVAMTIGNAVDRAVESDLIAKRDAGAALPADVVADSAAMSFDSAWSNEEPWLDAAERERGEAAVKGAAKDQSIALAVEHNRVLTPSVSPVHVQRRVRVSVPSLRYDIEGTFDLQTADGWIRDVKTSGKLKTANDVASSVQVGLLYPFMASIVDGKWPERAAMHVLQKTKKPRAYVVDAPVLQDTEPLMQRIRRVERSMETGLFIPADPTSWMCSAKWCGFFDECLFGRRSRVQVAMSNTEE